MLEPRVFELSRRLFSAHSIDQIAQSLAETLCVQILSDDLDAFSVQIQACQEHSAADAEDFFLEALVDSVIAGWGDATLPTWHSNRPQARAVDLTLRLTTDQDDGPCITLVVDPSVHTPHALLNTLAPLREHARIFMESTNPLDRFILRISPRNRSLTPVLELLEPMIHQSAGVR